MHTISTAPPGSYRTPTIRVGANARTFQFDPRRAALPPRDYQRELTEAAWLATSKALPGDCKVVFLATGAGKTRVINDVLFGNVLPAGARVLWLAPDWELIAQAMDDGCARYPHARAITTYIGGTGTEMVLFGAPRAPLAQLTFVTLQTLFARRHTDFANREFDVIVLDEVHYGEHGKLQAWVYARYKKSAIFLGATATKRIDSKYDVVGNHYDLAALVARGVLAKPELVSVETNIEWSPGVDKAAGDITAHSLDELARNDARNELIVETYLQNAALLGPTILFACNIAHAEHLKEMLGAAGVRAVVTHSRMKNEQAKEAVSRFRTGDADVITNVRSLTTGVDIPQTSGILLARPTTSDILLTQMIGRGSRKTTTKQSFTVVDFVDNVTGPNGVYVRRPDGFFGTPAWTGTRRPMHEHVPAKLEPMRNNHPALVGLAIQPTQSFSVEFLVAPASAHTSSGVVDRLQKMFASASVGESSWTVTETGSFTRLVSPIHLGGNGLAELASTLDELQRVLSSHGYGLVPDAPMHIFLGWCPDLHWLANVVRYVGFYEPALASLTPPPGRTRASARPARRAVGRVVRLHDADAWFDHVNHAGGTYDAFDMRPLFEKGYAVDFPLHTDALDGAWTATWISMAMHVLRAAEEGRTLNGDPERRVQSAPLCRGPRGRVEELSTFIGGGGGLTARLRAQRHRMVTHWLSHARFARLARRVEESWLAAS